nr:hypothetical protein CFP56_27204 [Quercus suber]
MCCSRGSRGHRSTRKGMGRKTPWGMGLGLKWAWALLPICQDTSNSQNINPDQDHGTMDESFVLGPQASKVQGNKNISKETGPTQKVNKVRRDYVGKENNTGRARGKVHGEIAEGDTSMDVEAKAIGGKRKERIPLEEISIDEKVGKK